MMNNFFLRLCLRKQYVGVLVLAIVFFLKGCSPATQDAGGTSQASDEVEIVQTPLGEARISPGEVSGVLTIIVGERGAPNLIFLKNAGGDEYFLLNVTEATIVIPPRMKGEGGIISYELGKMHHASGSMVEMEDREALAKALGWAGLPAEVRRPVILEVSELHLLETQ